MSLNTYVNRLMESHPNLTEKEAKRVGVRLFWALLAILAFGYICIVSIAGYTSPVLALCLAVVYSLALLWFFNTKMRDSLDNFKTFESLKFVSKLRYAIFILDILAVAVVLALKSLYLL